MRTKCLIYTTASYFWSGSQMHQLRPFRPKRKYFFFIKLTRLVHLSIFRMVKTRYSQDLITGRLISGKSRYPAIFELGYQILAAMFVSRMTENRTNLSGYWVIKTKWRPSCFCHDPITGPVIRSLKQNGGHISGPISDICPDAKLDCFIKKRVIKIFYS